MGSSIKVKGNMRIVTQENGLEILDLRDWWAFRRTVSLQIGQQPSGDNLVQLNITRVISQASYSGQGQDSSIEYYVTLLNNTLKARLYQSCSTLLWCALLCIYQPKSCSPLIGQIWEMWPETRKEQLLSVRSFLRGHLSCIILTTLHHCPSVTCILLWIKFSSQEAFMLVNKALLDIERVFISAGKS